MDYEVPRTWFGLTLRLMPGRTLIVQGRDDKGHTWVEQDRQPTLYRPISVPGGGAPYHARIPVALEDAIAAAANSLPLYRTGSQTNVVLPVFLTPPEGLEGLGWETIGPQLLQQPARSRFAVIVRSEATTVAAAFRLPMRVLLVGNVGGDTLDVLRKGSTWFQREDGLIEPVWVRNAEGARQLTGGAPFDAVITDGWSAAELTAQRGTHRLAVVVESTDQLPITPTPKGLARSTISIGSPEYPAVVRDLFDRLSHDLPLHQAVADLGIARESLAARLTSSPEAVHDLRLMGALGRVEQSRRDLQARFGSNPTINPDIAAALGNTLADIDFAFESGGLYPIADARDQLNEAEAVASQLPVATSPNTERVLDVQLRRGWDVVGATRTIFLPTDSSLQAGAHYHLDVHIGQRADGSIVVGAQPPIDPLLPDSRHGWDLEVVVHAGTFAVTGPTIRPLQLPPAGASETVTFDLTSPSATGPAWLRLSVLYQDNLLQTYRVTALVEEAERVHPHETVSKAELDQHATSDWTNIDHFRRRALSLVLNSSPIDGTHHVFVKSGGTEMDLPVDSRFQLNAVSPIRATLTTAVRQQADPANTLRDLVKQGREAWGGLFDGLAGGEAERFREISRSTNEILQITRVDATQSIPWSLFYDWLLPAELTATTEVCWGLADAGIGQPCDHRWDSRVVCVRGFWGVRHQIEERIGRPAGNQPDHLRLRDGRLAVDLALGLSADKKPVKELIDDFAKLVALAQLEADRPLLDRLWDSDLRAPIVAVLGHHDVKTQAIDCGTSEKKLIPQMIRDRRQLEGPWAAPAPLLMLLACEAGAVSPDSVTNHVRVFTTVGAAAVIATECVIRTSNARAFATGLLEFLAAPNATVGSAMQATRAMLLAKTEIAVLAFVAFGSADVTVDAG